MKKFLRAVYFLLLSQIFLFPLLNLSSGETLTNEKYAELRKNARERRRKVILNNDGCDVIYFPEKLEITRENFLSRRISFLAGMCDTLMYCPGSAGQGHFTLSLPGADLLSGDPPKKGFVNIARVLHKRGDDYFQWIIDFCRKNDMEIFFSFRFNDTHDVRHRPDNPSIFFSRFKNENRHLLFGRDHTESPRNGWWSSLDFSRPEVRKRQIELTKAVLEKYDVDGIDLDFSRYLRIFPRTARGEKATAEELEMMTALMRDIRKVIDEYGKKRSKAILLSVVLPDDPELCRNLGYDMDEWFRENLVDIWQQSDGFQLGFIAQNAEKARRHNVKYYAFGGSPYPYNKLEKGSLMNRSSRSAYAGRLSNALAGGADGIYLYNVSNQSLFKTATGVRPDGPKRYFVTSYSWEIPRGYCFSPEDYLRYSQLTAHVKCTVSPGAGKLFTMEINDPPTDDGVVTAYIDRTAGAKGNLTLSLNGQKLLPGKIVGRYESFAVPEKLIKRGKNIFEVKALAADGESPVWFAPEKLNEFELRFFGTENSSALEENSPGEFTVYGRNTAAGLAKRFANLEFSVLRFSFSARVLQEQAFVRTANSGYAMKILLLPDKIVINENDFVLPLDTGKFHRYQIVMQQDKFVLSVDGKEIFSGTAKSGFTPESLNGIPDSARVYGSSSSFIFGVPGKTSGIAQCKDMCIDSPVGSIQIGNLMLEVLNREKMTAFSGGKFRAASGRTGRRTLDGRALPFAGKADKVISGGKMTLSPGSRRTVWVISDGKSVSAWIITSGGVSVWPGSPVAMHLNDGTQKDVYSVVIRDGKHKLFCNNVLVYTAGNAEKMVYKNGEFFNRQEVQTPEEFISDYGSRFTPAEQKVIQNGGMLARGLREYDPALVPGELFSFELYEKGEQK